jgi:polyisoprenoid-binding protein YceI
MGTALFSGWLRLFNAGYNVIGQAEEGILLGRILERCKAGLGGGNIVPGTDNGGIDPAIVVNQVEDRLEIAFVQNILVDYLSDPLPFSGSALPESMDQGKGYLSLLQVMTNALAKLFLAGNVIERIIHELERDAESHAEIAERLFASLRRLAEDGPCLAGCGEKDGGFAFNHFDIAFFGKVQVAGGYKLEHFPFRNDGSGSGEDPEHIQVAGGDHQGKGLGKEEIADENGRLVAPEGIGGGETAAEIGIVDNIIVEQGRRVNEFDHAGQGDMAVAPVPAQPGSKQQQGRPDPLTAAGEDVLSHLADQRDIRLEVLFELLFDIFQVFPDKGKCSFHLPTSALECGNTIGIPADLSKHFCLSGQPWTPGRTITRGCCITPVTGYTYRKYSPPVNSRPFGETAPSGRDSSRCRPCPQQKGTCHMNRFAPAIAAVALLLSPTLSLAATWQLDHDHTSVQFKVRHLMVSYVKGVFHNFNGTVDIDDQDITRSRISVTINTDSVDTGVAKRDADLRSANFFDVAHYPVMTFTSKKIVRNGANGLKVTGDLTIHGTTREVVLDVEGPTPAIKDPWGGTRRGASAFTTINRKDFGLMYNKLLETGGVVVGDDVAISIEAELVRK